MRVNPQQAARLRVPKDVLRLVHLREDREATLVEGSAVQRRRDMPGSSLEKSNAEIPSSSCLIASGAVDRARPRSDAAAAKLRRSTIRMKSCMRSSRSMALFTTTEF
jgi:hypothetical protein